MSKPYDFSKLHRLFQAGLIFALFSLCSAGVVHAASVPVDSADLVGVSQNTEVTPPTPSSSDDAVVLETRSGCALLDDPMARSMMSGALETALLHACGRAAELSSASADTQFPYAPMALGDDALVNDPAGEVTAMTQDNVVLAQNETSGALCAAYDDSYHGFVQAQGYTGFSSSLDRGATWNDHGSLNSANSYGYPSLTWRRVDGHFYLATLYNNGLGLWDLGAACDAATWVGMIHTGATDDREQITADNNPSSPYYGRLYVVWTDFADEHIYMTRSSDGGQLWAVPVDVSEHALVNAAWPAVDPITGDVYVAWTHWDAYPAGPIDIEMARSTDGGGTWTPVANPMSDQTNPRDATATTNCGRPALNGDIRYLPAPQVAIDENRALHVVYSYDPDGYNTGDVVNVYYRRSTDQGATWLNQIRISDFFGTTDQFSPALALGEGAEVGIFWYDRQLDQANNLSYDRYMSISRDGGQIFDANQRISDESSPVVHDTHLATCYHGDYDRAAAGGGYFYTAWGDDRRGDGDVWSDTEPYTWLDLYGTVYDENTGRGLDNGSVVTVHTLTGLPLSGVTDQTGYYLIHVPDVRPYAVTAQVYGYAPNTGNIHVTEAGGQADIPLTPVSRWDVSGQVTDANTGYPVYARISVSGNPFDPPEPQNETWTDGFTGDYAFSDLAASNHYTLTIAAQGYLSQIYDLGALTADVTDINIAIQPDLIACTAPGYQQTPACQLASGAVLQPEHLEAEGCPCETQSHTLAFANHFGADGEVLLSYVTTPGVSVEMPASLGVVPNTGVRFFDVMVKLDRGMVYSTTVYVTVTASMASNPLVLDTTVIAKRTLDPIAWGAAAPSPSVSMDGAVIEHNGKLYNIGGYGSDGAVDIYDPESDSWSTGAAEPAPIITFPVDACFGYVTPADPVILLMPDASGDVSGIWHRYHIATDTWDTPALPAALPANGIWAPDMVVDYRNNRCYISGGATTPGNGNLTTLYRYNPADNSAALLGNFTHIPGGFDFHAGWYVPWIGTAGGVCMGGGIGSTGVASADTQCYDIAAAAFNPPNADLGMLPEPWWGMADMEKIHAAGRQLWLANGINTGWSLLQRSAYFSQENGRFVYGPNPLHASYRVEGAAVQDRVYLMDGSTGGFSPSQLNEQLLQCPACDCGVELQKAASAVQATPGQTITYSVVITASSWLTGTVQMVDKLPDGVTFAGYVEATYGTAWYDAADNAIYWTRPTALAFNQVAPALPQPEPLALPREPLPVDIANLSDLPYTLLPSYPTALGDVIETFPNAWATNGIGLVYNPETAFVRFAHEGNYGVFDVNYPIPHPLLQNIKLSVVNPGWLASLDNRDGVGYDHIDGHYFLPDYQGDMANRDDNLVEIDPAGHIINAWEMDGADNDSYDGSIINQIIDIAVVPGVPARYFATALGDTNLVYEIDLRKAGQFIAATWGTQSTCNVPGIGDTAGIDYDAQNGVFYHSDLNSANIVVTDLRCNVLATFTCDNGISGVNTGVTFVEGKWPPEVWVTDYVSNQTTRCEAPGREPAASVVHVTYAVEVTAPVSTLVNNRAVLACSALECADPLAHSILLIRTNDVGGSIQRALDELGYAYDTLYANVDWTGIDFTPYDVVVIGMDGGSISVESVEKIRTDVVDAGKRVIVLGGTAHSPFVTGVNQYLVANDTTNYGWVLTASPHFTLLDATHPFAQGLPSSRDFINVSARYYQLRVTDTSIETIAQNGDGYPSYFYKTYPIGGDLIWFVHTPRSSYWSNPADFDLLKRILANSLTSPREYHASASFQVVPTATITWTKEIYINGIFAGYYDAGPFTAASGDDVQIVDRLDYAGAEPRFVQLTNDWSGAAVTQSDEYHSRGVIANGDWYVTLLPGVSVRRVQTVHINDSGPTTVTDQLIPDGLPVQARVVVLEPLQFIKAGPTIVEPEQLITYTITLSSHQPLYGSFILTDTLPPGVEYVGNLHFNNGHAWYDAVRNAILWTATSTSPLTNRSLRWEQSPPHQPGVDNPVKMIPVFGPLSVRNVLPAVVPPEVNAPQAVSATWNAAAPIPRAVVRYAHAQCYGESNRFYIISGVSDGVVNNVWRYDADDDAWMAMAPFPSPVEGASAVCYQGYIYVAGGGGTNQFYIYDIILDTWMEGPYLPRGVWGAAMGAWDGRLFLVGGDSDFFFGGQSNEVNIYDIATGTWLANGTAMPVAASAPGWVQINEYLYVVGGWSDALANNVNASQRYNMAENTWEAGPTFNSARSDFTLAATGHYLYAIGGDADGGSAFDASTLVEQLDYTQWASAIWTDIADPLPDGLTANHGGFCTAAQSGGEIWSVGGLNSGWVFVKTNQYRPSEPCADIPPFASVTITFVVRVTAEAGATVTNTAALDFRGTPLITSSAFNLPNYKIYLPIILR